MIFVLVVLMFCAVIFVMANSANDNYQQYLRKVADGERLWTVDAYDNRSLLTGEKLGHNIAINGDSIYYGLDSHELIVNETEYQLLHMRLKAKNEGKSYFYFGNNKNYYNNNDRAVLDQAGEEAPQSFDHNLAQQVRERPMNQ